MAEVTERDRKLAFDLQGFTANESMRAAGAELVAAYRESCVRESEAAREKAEQERDRYKHNAECYASVYRVRVKALYIKPSPTADTRTCDWSQVSKEQLLASSLQHKRDIGQALGLFMSMLADAAVRHDFDKLTAIDHFHADFRTGFKETGWWDQHRKLNRHHLMQADGVPGNVNLVDVLDFIADCVMAGLARSGSVYELKLPDELLQEAFQNTVRLLIDSTEVRRG